MAPKRHQIDDKQETAAEQGVTAEVRWNTRSLKSIYANFCSESITRNCGCTRQDTEIEIAHRVVLSSFTAKRCSDLPTKVIGEHEPRYGERKR